MPDDGRRQELIAGSDGAEPPTFRTADLPLFKRNYPPWPGVTQHCGGPGRVSGMIKRSDCRFWAGVAGSDRQALRPELSAPVALELHTGDDPVTVEAAGGNVTVPPGRAHDPAAS
jgi:hypothetical protein